MHPDERGGPAPQLDRPDQLCRRCHLVTGGWTGIDTFYVKDRFLAFTHWVAVQVQPSLLLRAPADTGVPSQDLTCPK